MANKKQNQPKKQTKNYTNKHNVTSTRGPNYPLVQEAVARAIQEYGETLKKLARDDS